MSRFCHHLIFALTLVSETLSFAASPDSAALHPVMEITGYGRNLEDAKQDARQHLLESVQEMLDSHEPPLVLWKPSLADVDLWIQGKGRAGPSVDVKPLGLQHQWIVPVRMPSVGELELRDRQVCRQRWAGQGFLATMALMGLYLAGDFWRSRR